jgi:hypothetical protein
MNAFRATIFPAKSRFLPAHRWINITLRTLHLIGITGLGAGFFYMGVDDAWYNYFYLTLGTGLLLTLLSVWSNGIWLVQLRGQLIIFKLLLLITAMVLPDLKLGLVILLIALSSVVSHAPGDIRYYSLYHRRRIESL